MNICNFENILLGDLDLRKIFGIAYNSFAHIYSYVRLELHMLKTKCFIC